MEEKNKNWFDPQDQGFSDIWGEKNKYKNKISFNSNENSANQAYDNQFLNKKRKMPKTKKEYVLEIKRLMHEGGLEEEYLFIKKKAKKSSKNEIPPDNDTSFQI